MILDNIVKDISNASEKVFDLPVPIDKINFHVDDTKNYQKIGRASCRERV